MLRRNELRINTEILSAVSFAFCFLFLIGPLLPRRSTAPIPESRQIMDVFFVDARHGWILLDENKNRALFSTSDGGETWSRLGIHQTFLQLFFEDVSSGWATGMDSSSPDAPQTFLYHTTDRGVAWSRISTLSNSQTGQPIKILDFRFVDDKKGWFVGEGSGGTRIVLNTNDAGQSIKSVGSRLPGNGLLFRVDSQGRNRLWMFGQDLIVSSIDGGRTWTAPVDPDHMVKGLGTVQLRAGLVLNNVIGWAAGQASGPVIIATGDYGKNWHVVLQAQDGFFSDISFGDHLHGCATTGDTRVFCTSDSGTTWKQMQIPLQKEGSNPLREFGPTKIRFSSPQRAWLVAHTRLLYRSDDSGLNWREVKLP
jgi:photosystem II stability/assembly factor-like uncharacterized protein